MANGPAEDELMKKHVDVIFGWAAVALCGLAVLAGCNQSRSLFQKPSNLNAPSPAGAQTAPGSQPVAHPNTPYVLSAKSAGSFIEFSIYNMGDKDLPVKREDFAVISPESREVTPYSRDGAVIDLPQPALVKPNSTMHGRAIFKSISNPLGQRLVFKPDDIGTFADINPQ